ncbi:unnamed protein product, partial [Closterium sp. Naga37s-1]
SDKQLEEKRVEGGDGGEVGVEGSFLEVPEMESEGEWREGEGAWLRGAERALGHEFAKKDLLLVALTHPSLLQQQQQQQQHVWQQHVWQQSRYTWQRRKRWERQGEQQAEKERGAGTERGAETEKGAEVGNSEGGREEEGKRDGDGAWSGGSEEGLYEEGLGLGGSAWTFERMYCVGNAVLEYCLMLHALVAMGADVGGGQHAGNRLHHVSALKQHVLSHESLAALAITWGLHRHMRTVSPLPAHHIAAFDASLTAPAPHAAGGAGQRGAERGGGGGAGRGGVQGGEVGGADGGGEGGKGEEGAEGAEGGEVGEVQWVVSAPRALSETVQALAGAVFLDAHSHPAAVWQVRCCVGAWVHAHMDAWVFAPHLLPLFPPCPCPPHPMTELQHLSTRNKWSLQVRAGGGMGEQQLVGGRGGGGLAGKRGKRRNN